MQIKINVPDGFKLVSTVDGKSYEADPVKMTNESLLYQLEYGHQRCVNDRTGGKDKTAEDKAKIAAEMIDRLTAETFERRRVGAGVDPVVGKIRAIMRGLLGDKQFAERKAEYKAISSDDQDARGEYLDGWFATLAEASQAKITKAAEKQLADERKQRADVAALADDAALTI